MENCLANVVFTGIFIVLKGTESISATTPTADLKQGGLEVSPVGHLGQRAGWCQELAFVPQLNICWLQVEVLSLAESIDEALKVRNVSKSR